MSYGEQILEGFMRVMSGEEYMVNYRPDWMMGLELDFYFPRKRVGIEFQGDHHYQPTEYSQDYHNVRRNDGMKRRLCRDNGITLIRLDAIDLEYKRLRHKIKALRFWKLPKLRREHMPELRRLNKEAVEYRRLLRERFNSPTALRRSNPKRKKIILESRKQVITINTNKTNKGHYVQQ